MASSHAFAACVALLPLALYLLLVGWINLRARPLVVSGTREMAALGVGLVGLVIIGPMQLFLPEATVQRFGSAAWLLLLAFYALSFTLLLLVARSRVVIYNVTADQLRAVLAETALRLDAEACWAGDSLALPQLGVQLRMETFSPMGNVVLVANGDEQSFGGWRQLERSLRAALATQPATPSRQAAWLVVLALAILAAVVQQAVTHPDRVAQGFLELLRR